ncbi:MAG: hypothetical protein GY899_11950, partial [Verrucomicrobiaceae bacterium]|nr:hypothetical protein [Verrucomicrobiaceae bacterium]
VIDCRVFTTIAQGRWPSDHAGTLAEFSLTPVDADADGLHDAWEVANFGAITTQDSSGDADLDSLNNFAEQGFGSNPNNAGDLNPLRTSIAGDALQITYRRINGGSEDDGVYTVEGVRYLIELSSDLQNWVLADDRSSLLGNPLAVGNRIEEATYKVTPQVGSDRVFVRLRLESDTP